jgi:two-component system, LuxR family, sensor histidine kinase DctS
MTAGAKDVKSVSVLLVEDNPADARLVREYLKEAHSVEFHVTKVARMSEALEKLGNAKFDVIILDLSLPDCSGLQTFELIAKPARRTPVIVLTGLEEAETERQLAARGAHDYLRKRHLEPNILAAVVLNAATKK